MSDNQRSATMFEGAAYEKHHGQWSRAIGREFVKWLALPSGLRWLDVGCGTGAASDMVLAEGDPSAIMGIDASESQVAYAAANIGDARARFQVGNALSLEFENDAFDAAVSVLVLNLLPDPAKGLAEMKRVVRPGGTVASYVWDISEGRHPSSPMVDGLAALDPQAPGFGGGGTRRIESRNDLMGLFEEGGLTDIAVRKIDTSVRYASFEDYWQDVLVHQGPPGVYIRHLASEGLQRLRDILSNSVPKNNAGEVVYPAVAWAARGRVPD